MTFGYQRSFEDERVSLQLEYQQPLSGTSSPNEVEGELRIQLDETWLTPVSASINESDSLSLTDTTTEQSKIDEGETTLNINFSGLLAGATKNESIKVEIEDSDGNHSLVNAKVPSDLNLIAQLADDSPPASAIRRFSEKIDSDVGSTFSLIDRASYAVNAHQFFRLVNTVAGERPEIADIFHENIYDTLANVLSGDGLGRYTDINSFTEFRNLIQTYNQQPHLHAYSFVDFVEDSINSNCWCANEGGIEWFVNQTQSPAFSFDQLADDELAVLLAGIIKLSDVQEAQTYVYNHTQSDIEWEEFTELADQAKNHNGPSDRATAFRDLLADGAHLTSKNFAFVLTHYLHWHAKSTIYTDKSDAGRRLLYYDLCQTLAEDETFEHLAEMAAYERSMAKGWIERKENNEEAISHFENAAAIAADQSGAWNRGQYSLFLPALREQTWCEVELERSADNYDEAITLLNRRLEVIEALENINSTIKKETLQQLRAFRNEIEGNRFLANQQYQQALEAFSRAAGGYKQSDHEGLFRGVVGRKYQVKALLKEVDGDFITAAELHEKYVETLPNSSGARYYRGRSYLCRAKAHLLDNNIDDAFSNIKEINQSSDYLLPHEEQFQLLLEATADYRDGKISDVSRFVDGFISGMDNSEQYLLDFSDNYVTGFLTVLAAQRLRKLPVSDDVRDILVTLALEEACYPSSIGEISPEDIDASLDLADISLESEWQLSLPRYILDHLETVRTERQTTFDDYSGLARDLIIPLEQHLAIIVEYHLRQCYQDGWNAELEGESPLSLGDYIQFFSMEASECLSNISAIRTRIDLGTIDERPVTQLRNALGHGRNPGVSNSSDTVITEEQFEEIYDAITELMKLLEPDTPVISEIEEKFSDSVYRVRFHWNRVTKRAWLDCDTKLELNELYYISQDALSAVRSGRAEVAAEEIVPCEEGRARSFILEAN